MVSRGFNFVAPNGCAYLCVCVLECVAVCMAGCLVILGFLFIYAKRCWTADKGFAPKQ